MAKDELKTLTSLRGVAALLVAVFHVPNLFGVRMLAPHAYLAVDFFFVLSGFVLTHAYGERIGDGRMGLGAFARARLARLYPLYVLATLAGAGLLILRMLAHTVAADVRVLLALPLALGFVPAPPLAADPTGALFPFVSQAWSLLWELVVGFGLFAWLRTGLRGLELGVALALGLLVAATWNRVSLDGGWQHNTFWIGAVRAVFGFAAGGFVRRRIEMIAAHRRALGWAALAAGAGALVYIVLIPRPDLVAELALVVLGFPTLVAGAALTTRRWMTGGALEATGQASYSVYLLHGPLGLATAMVLSRLHHASGAWLHVFGPIWTVALVGLSWLSWRHIEEPARRLWLAHASLRRPSNGSGPAAAQPAWG